MCQSIGYGEYRSPRAHGRLQNTTSNMDRGHALVINRSLALAALLGWGIASFAAFKLYETNRTLSKTSLELLSTRQEAARLRLVEKELAGLSQKQAQLAALLRAAGRAPGDGATEPPSFLREEETPAVPMADAGEVAVDLQPENPIPHLWPVAGWITQEFRPEPGQDRPSHLGIDLAARLGSPVIAPADAEVLRVYWDDTLGRILELQHSAGHVTRYAHLQKVEVRPGEAVETGQIVARLGNSGRSTAPHLHYEVELRGVFLDPRAFLPEYERGMERQRHQP